MTDLRAEHLRVAITNYGNTLVNYVERRATPEEVEHATYTVDRAIDVLVEGLDERERVQTSVRKCYDCGSEFFNDTGAMLLTLAEATLRFYDGLNVDALDDSYFGIGAPGAQYRGLRDAVRLFRASGGV